ncbi:ankyrin repeat domain-containing protein 12 isoform X1 [Corythoichthys intestinalis]|uniref:ankyrin repeat domain-containing protein 12 isoform X1 n=1 Tax=Corythoichthys intestinalis TaxID=161448 RepID=UPI0025A57393|nr:ankyrin repeat domain-containing protein 12 isoform X1 [Corythoichthys intestinalis]
MAKPGSDRDGAMVEKQAGKKCKEKLSPFTKTPKLDRSELLVKDGKVKSSMKRKLSFTNSPPRATTEERDSDTDESDPGQCAETWGERLAAPCRTYADKDGPDKKKVKKEASGKKSQAPNLLFGYPLSERKQMALLMKMTATSPDSTPSHPSQTTPVPKKVPSSSSSRQKDKVNKRNERGETPLHMAAIRGDAKQVKELISLGADVNVKDFAGWTPLHEACNLGYYDVAKVLIAAGAEVNTQGLDDDTPLHDASSSGHKNIVKLLLRHGGDAFQANKRGERPVDVADSKELEQLLKGEVVLSDQDDSSSDSEDPPSVNPSSMDDNMDDSDTEKDSEAKVKSSSCMQDLDEYEFKDEEEEEDLSKALSDRHILRRELRQREKEDKECNNVAGKQIAKGDTPSKCKKPKMPRMHCSSDTSSDERESLPDKRSSPTCSQSSEGVKTKKECCEQKDKGKVKKKNKSQNKNKENQEDGKENSKTLVLQLATVAESTEKGREEDSFKMSFSPKDDSSVHLFHLTAIKSPKLNHSMADKHTPLKQENSSCPADTIKYNHYSDVDYSTEGSSTKAHKHKEKSKHHQRDGEREDGRASPVRDATVPDSTEVLVRKTDPDGKMAKKHKLKHKEKDKHRREYEAERSRHRQKDARRDGHRNLEFDREFWKENFFKSDETDDVPPVKRDVEEHCSLQRMSDCSPFKEEKNAKEKHSSGKDKRPRDERDKDKAVKKERREERPRERDDRGDGGGRVPDAELPQSNSVKEETDEKPITLTADQEHLESPREKTEKRLPGKEKEPEKMERRHSDKEKKLKPEHTDRVEPQTQLERWKEKERSAAASSHLPGDKNYKESDKVKSLSSAKKHEDSRKCRDKQDKRLDREYSITDHREKDRVSSDKKVKPMEKTSDHGKSDRSKEKDCERKRKEKLKDASLSSSSNLKLLLEEKKLYLSESGKSSFTKSKEEATRTPDKDRDRRERDRDLDRHKDKERHKDRSQQTKTGKGKPNELDADKPKTKTSTVGARDVRPKEKRLVNDDLMQTSFERMLSLKDQEIEQWHRKHLEKIKQKERERLKQKPLADGGKSRSKDRTKTDACFSKELIRSKSSDASDAHNREKSLKDVSSLRTISLDGKSLPSIGAKVMSAVENCLTRSPRPDGEQCNLISRSVSLLSVVSSEDSCQAAVLTPKQVEYDSDMNPEALDIQPSFLQSSLVIQATRLPSVLEKDCVVLPDAQRQTLPSRHESPYLRAILDEDANASNESRASNSLPKSHAEGPRMREASTERDEVGIIQQCSNSESVEECKDTASSSSPIREPPSLTLCGSPAVESSDATVMRDIPCLESPTSQLDATSRDSDLLSASVSTEPPKLTKPEILQTEDSIPINIQPTISSSAQLCDQKEKPSTADSSEHQSAENIPECVNMEDRPVLSTIATESLPSTEFKCPQENQDLRPPDVVTCDIPMEMLEDGPSTAKDQEKCDPQQIFENPQTSLLEDQLTEFSSESHSEPMDVDSSDRKPESLAEQSSLAAMQPAGNSDLSSSSSCSSNSSSSSSGSSSASGSSSPQSGETESDCSDAKLKLRSSDDDVDLHVPHPRKRKMPKQPSCQAGPAPQLDQERERGEPIQQQSLAAIVASVKLEEIEPYQTERANPYYEFLHIRRKIEEKRKVLCSVAPQPPQYYDEYVTFNGSYLLDGNPLSKLCIPTITPPPSLPDQLKEMFKQQEMVRMKLRLQHSIEREKLIVSNEQEVLRVHYRAARTLANQTLPFSACTVLLDAEVYNMPQEIQNDDGKTSVRDRFNARQFMSWLQDVDDKFDKLKTCLLMRQQHEAAALNAVQRLEWQLKLQELDPATYKSTSIFEIPEFYIPLVEVNDDFDLTPI